MEKEWMKYRKRLEKAWKKSGKRGKVFLCYII